MTKNLDMTSAEFAPLGKFVLVRPVELNKGEAVTETGIVTDLEENNSIIDRPTTGEVIKVGPGNEDIEVGQTVLWPDTDGQEMIFADGEFMLLQDYSILGFRE